MLATLLQDKVRGGKWHTLNDKVGSELNLFCSAHQVLGKEGAAGVDRQTVGDFAEQEQEELRRLQEQLRDGSYYPAPVRRVMTPKPGSQEKRPLGIPLHGWFLYFRHCTWNIFQVYDRLIRQRFRRLLLKRPNTCRAPGVGPMPTLRIVGSSA